MNNLPKAIELIQNANYIIAFTGAGISVESGIPPFRGENGLWNKYDPKILTLSHFRQHPEESWPVIKTIFYEFFNNSMPNPAHLLLAKLEETGKLKAVITQNIDGLHQKAGSKNVLEFHGTAQEIICTGCKTVYKPSEINLSAKPPLCAKCDAVLKPNFVFFEEGIPEKTYRESFDHANKADLVIIVGAGGEVMPAAYIPYDAKKAGAKIIEINTEESSFTYSLYTTLLKGKAGEVSSRISEALNL